MIHSCNISYFVRSDKKSKTLARLTLRVAYNFAMGLPFEITSKAKEPMAMIEIGLNRVRKNFGFRNVLDGASMEIHTGERAAIVGPNGPGKSTILRLIAGDEAPDAGEVSLRRGARMGVLWQIPPLRAPGVTVEQVLLEPFAGLISMERRKAWPGPGRRADGGVFRPAGAVRTRGGL